jgi:hypothetical protein
LAVAVAVPKLADLLFAATRRALHLELRDAYAPSARFLAWQRRQPHGRNEADDQWRDLLAPLVARDGDIRRLRVVSEPLSEYARYEFAVTPEANIAAGESVRWLPRAMASGLRFPGNDFWLIDERLLFNLHGGDGSWLGVEADEDPDVIRFCSESFETAWAQAIEHCDYRPAG